MALSALNSGCTRKAEGQTIAVVNGQEITAPDLNFALEQAKIPDNADKNAARSQVLQQLVDRRLLAEQARKEGIDKTPEYLNRQRLADETLLITMLASRRLNTAQLPSDREVQNFISTHPEIFDKRETWSLDQLMYPTPTNAALKGQILAAHSIDQLAAVLQKNNVASTRQKNRLDTANIPPELYGQLAKLPAGEPFAASAGQQTVASAITAREPNPISGDRAKPVAVETMRKTQTAKALEDMLKSLRSSAKVEYQPGYGPPKKS
jgi:EpsD family peptidyl-prolyl cis-trans isomerase